MAVDCTTCFPDDYTRVKDVRNTVFPCATLPPQGYTPPPSPCPQHQPVYARAMPERQEMGGCEPCDMGEIDQRDQCTRCGESVSGVGKAAGGHGHIAHAGHAGHAAGGHAGAQPHAARPQGGGAPQSAQRAPQASGPHAMPASSQPAHEAAPGASLQPRAHPPHAGLGPAAVPGQPTHTAEVGPAAQHYGQQSYPPLGQQIQQQISKADAALQIAAAQPSGPPPGPTTTTQSQAQYMGPGFGRCGLCGGPL